MIKIKDYARQIDELHEQGFCAIEISKKLGLTYSQPVYNYFKKKGWERLTREEYTFSRQYQVNEHFFDAIDTEEKAYVFGFICADGHIDTKHHRIVIALQQTDVELLQKIRSVMDSSHPIVEHIQKRNPYTKANHLITEQACISINGKDLIEPLIRVGLNSRKTYTLNGSEISIVPKHLIRHFLRGYFDGDGNIVWGKEYSSGKKYIISVCGNKDFLENTFQKYFPSINVLSKDKVSKQCYTWRVSGKLKVLEFLNYLYADSTIYLERKYKTYKYAMWSFKTGLIAGNSYFINLIEGQSAANPLVKCWRQVQRLMDETFPNPYGEEYNSNTNAQQPDEFQVEDIV